MQYFFSNFDYCFASVNKIFSKFPSLYAIADEFTLYKNSFLMTEFAEGFFKGGGRLLQIRFTEIVIENRIKLIRKLIPIADKYNALLIINNFGYRHGDREFIAHFGQNDMRNTRFFGRSTHNLKEINAALKEKPIPTYIGFGAVFNSPTKPNISQADLCGIEIWKGPIVFIGGITLENVAFLPKKPHYFYAVITDFFRYGNTAKAVEKYTQDFIQLVD